MKLILAVSLFLWIHLLQLSTKKCVSSFTPLVTPAYRISISAPLRGSTDINYETSSLGNRNVKVTSSTSSSSRDFDSSPFNKRFLIHWKGEDKEAYTFGFRHDEFRACLEAVMADRTSFDVTFRDALFYTGDKITNQMKRESYNQAMQYVHVSVQPESATGPLLEDNIKAAIERCSLVHAAFDVVAEAPVNHEEDPFERLVIKALENGGLRDMSAESSTASWCVRVREFSNERNDRQGRRARSMKSEREALRSLTPLLKTFRGPVDLDNPDCRLYVFQGLVPFESTESNPGDTNNSPLSILLTRRFAQGIQRLSSLNPNTRICVTNTPLCPTAAALLCNVARLRPHDSIWDPYAGSGTILLTAALLVRGQPITTLGTELMSTALHEAAVRADGETRGLLHTPTVWWSGDSTDTIDRRRRRLRTKSLQQQPLDAIVTDPPYGIRESVGGGQQQHRRPIDDLLDMIRDDRDAGCRLLRVGGRLVVFLPHRPHEEDLHHDVLPRPEDVASAGLQCEMYREQRLNEQLSRWLVSFVCVE